MTLAAILVAYFLTTGSPAPLGQGQAAPVSQDPTSPTPAGNATPTAPNAAAQKPASPAKPASTHPRHKKPAPDCSTTPPAGGSGGSPAQKPCPHPKVVVRNGGTEEPTLQLKGGDAAEQAASQHSTEQLTQVAEENLKKIAERQPTPNQRDTVSQIRQFIDQSRAAVAAGDLDRAHNLALKARLLSDELLKP